MGMNPDAKEFVPITVHTSLSSMSLSSHCDAQSEQKEDYGHFQASSSDWDGKGPFEEEETQISTLASYHSSCLNPEAEEFLPGIGAVSSSTLPFEPIAASGSCGLPENSEAALSVRDALHQVRRLEEGAAATLQRFWRHFKSHSSSTSAVEQERDLLSTADKISTDQDTHTNALWAKWKPVGRAKSSQRKITRSASRHKSSKTWQTQQYVSSHDWFHDKGGNYTLSYTSHDHALSSPEKWDAQTKKEHRARSRRKSKPELRWRPKNGTSETVADPEAVDVADTHNCASEEDGGFSNERDRVEVAIALEDDAGICISEIGRRIIPKSDVQNTDDLSKDIRADQSGRKHCASNLAFQTKSFSPQVMRRSTRASNFHAEPEFQRNVKGQNKTLENKSTRADVAFVSQGHHSQGESSPWQHWEPSRVHDSKDAWNESQNGSKRDRSRKTSRSSSRRSTSKVRATIEQDLPSQTVWNLVESREMELSLSSSFRVKPELEVALNSSHSRKPRQEKSIERPNVVPIPSIEWKLANGTPVRRWGQETRSSAAPSPGRVGVSYYPSCSNRKNVYDHEMIQPSQVTACSSLAPLDVRWIQWQ